MAVKIGINGFGRIGRMVFRAALGNSEIEVVGINDLTDARSLANLFKYDSAPGVYPGEVFSDGDSLVVDGIAVPVTAERDPAKLSWGELGAQIVVEATGYFRDKENATKHLVAGAKQVVIAGPSPDADAVFVVGVNDHTFNPDQHHIVSLDSCATNCLAPLCKVMSDTFGVAGGFVTAIHDFTHDEITGQRESRALANGEPTLEMMGYAKGIGTAMSTVLPDMDGIVDGWYLRAPTPASSMIDLTLQLINAPSVEEINSALQNAAENNLKGVLQYNAVKVSPNNVSDNTHSSVVDGSLTTVSGHMVKLFSWYDSEWGYSNRIVDMVCRMANIKQTTVVEQQQPVTV